ncbi:hypothetical protein JOC54_000227 [Alkalihalobacillus xiaoxiensis]|uniref:Uncharacterized protein n=1 Tax=Shouchella xiaoxiensis TaxID=766895 RepID=A0ABS2SPS0_9BACI|nr:hypothetical protein [Shouchella xiaoxiensis]MBM7836996.1 hypothetical protein [Shouchella xiaoxiensis]
MKKGVLISVLIICIIVGSFFVIRAMNQAEDVALSDDFTSRFIDEDVETDEGFHYFESGNDKFSMWFPEGYILEGKPSYVSKESYETINLFKKADDDEQKLIKMTYYKGGDLGQVDGNLSLLISDYGFNDHYEVSNTDETHIYSGKSYVELIENRAKPKEPTDDTPANQYFALIKNQQTDQHVTVSYEIHCSVDCSSNVLMERSFFDSVVRSIRFQD